MSSLHLDMCGEAVGNKTSRFNEGCFDAFFFFLRRAILYRIDSLSFSPSFLHPWFSPPSSFYDCLLGNSDKYIDSGKYRLAL